MVKLDAIEEIVNDILLRDENTNQVVPGTFSSGAASCPTEHWLTRSVGS
jgi:hypothetical protein